MGCTDVDDKIVSVALKRDLPGVEGVKKVARQYEEEFWEGLANVNVPKPDHILRVSEHMVEIVEYVNELIKREAAYVVEGDGVYFDTGVMDRRRKKYGLGYGEFFGRGITIEGWRRGVEEEEENEGSGKGKGGGKKCVRDFALWKFHPPSPTSVSWPSPWGPGRPGWHIECSAFVRSLETLVSTRIKRNVRVQLHGGGRDLIFPHHENEVAQSTVVECGEGTGRDTWVSDWRHTGHVVGGEGVKMSKSDGTGVGLGEVEGDVFRWWCLEGGRWDRDVEWGEERKVEAERKGRRVREFFMGRGRKEQEEGEEEGEGKGWEVVEEVGEVLREFRDEVRGISVKAMKGGEMVEPKVLLGICDRIRDDERVRGTTSGGDKKIL
ncbi:hypothetical protein TrCOL_g4097 [Triparma columacea]|uniref:tRNA synthetases class I catalytic domain-containing protein n=1 Tax=Triparma columacea TaxID=722753 RepID=A0A9W7FYP9_9STRA|nr:hypothetical protein TrCOL_g4097 [Triparma columacea]